MPERDPDDDLTREVDALPRAERRPQHVEALSSRRRYEARKRRQKSPPPIRDLIGAVAATLMVLVILFVTFIVGYLIGRV